MIADEVPNGATLQLGIGGVPNAVGVLLRDKKDLGLHTEMFTDSMVDLLECGAVTNMKKPINVGKTIATLAWGTKKMYEYMDDNPAFEMHPVDYTNNPYVIGQHDNFISVNACVEIDLVRFVRNLWAHCITAVPAVRWTSCAARTFPRAARALSR